MEFLKFEDESNKALEDHNKKTDFINKMKDEKVIIPYITHTIYVTKKDERFVMNHPHVWETVDKLSDDIREGVQWKHIFWTNDRSCVIINATACEGRCEVRLFNELPGYQEVTQLISQMVESNIFIMDILKPMILYQFGGVYLSREFHYQKPFHFLHKVMDSYMGFEGMNWDGLSPGFVGARPRHQAMGEWKDFLLAYYGYQKDVYGVQELMPMPTFREDVITTSGPRSMTFAIWSNLNKWGNNDAIFSQGMIALDTCHESYKKNETECAVMQALPKSETIKIGGKDYTLERFGSYVYDRDLGYRTKSGRWHAPSELMWKLSDGNMEPHLWVFDMTDHVDILSPNYITKKTFDEHRNKYKGKSLVQDFLFDNWFSEYFKTNSGSYADPLIARRNDFDDDEYLSSDMQQVEL